MFAGQRYSDYDAALSSIGCGPEAALEIADKMGDIERLFQILDTEQDKQHLLGFQCFQELDAKYPLKADKVNHLIHRNRIEFDHEFVIRISWSLASLQSVHWNELKHLTHLQCLDLSDNDFSGYPPFSALPASLKSLDLTHNQFSGWIITADFPRNLQSLRLGDNAFSGIVDWLSLPQNLVILDLSQNALRGTVGWRSLSRYLMKLDLSMNGFTGSIDLCLLPLQLQELMLSDNEFSGSIDLCALPQTLRFGFFGDNILSETVDLSFLSRYLEELHLENNALIINQDIPENVYL